MIESKVKPDVKLEKLENTVINTKTVGEFRDLIQVCEFVGLKWKDGSDAIDLFYHMNPEFIWTDFRENTCVDIYGPMEYGPKSCYENKKVLSMEELCKANNMTSEKLNEIKKYLRVEVN